jgi:predicted nucleotidyltransferase
MKRDEILNRLRDSRREISDRFAVDHLALFGSAARDELGDDSDVDVLVSFRGRATFDGYMGLKTYLEDLIGRKVDLVTETGLKPRARPHVERDLIRVPWLAALSG